MSCQLLSLPPELRNQIYEYLFYIPSTTGTVKLVKKRQNARQSVLNILQTCRMIRNEALDIFYDINLVQVRGVDIWFTGNDLHSFLQGSTQARKDALRSLTISLMSCEDLTYCLKELRNMRFLRTLYLQVDARSFIRWAEREWSSGLLRKRVERATSVRTIRFNKDETSMDAEQIAKLDEFEGLFQQWIDQRDGKKLDAAGEGNGQAAD